MFKKLLKYLLYLTLTLVALVLTYLLAAFFLSRITINREASTKPEVQIYIKTNGVHTDIVVPVKNAQMDWSQEIKFANTTSNDSTAQFVAFGWGDKGFYLKTPNWSDLKFTTAFNAAFGFGGTAIHATFYKAIIENKSCIGMMISQEQYLRLTAFILNSLKKDSTGHAIYINTTANYNKRDAFYEATGSYGIFRTCNSWTNKALKVSGQKCCLWTAFDTPIFLKYK